jgi:RHS repeat-associated protein
VAGQGVPAVPGVPNRNGVGAYAMLNDDAAANQYTFTPMAGESHDANGNLIRLTPNAADGDADGDVDLDDYDDFADCFTGINTTGSSLPSGCPMFDFDADEDVDLDDFAVFQFAFGENPPEGGRWAKIAYDYRNRMVRYEDLATGQVHLYDYDALNRRVRKVVDSEGQDPDETRYYYSAWQVVQERDGDGEILAHYLYGRYIDEPLAMLRDTGGSSAFEEYFYLQDEQYNVVALVDEATGAVVERYDYSDYGHMTVIGTNGQPVLDVNSNAITASPYGNPYLFTGRRLDPETGLYYYRHRYYDPVAGRFTTSDPLGYVDGFNLYEYVRGNPSSGNDPLGLDRYYYRETGHSYLYIEDGEGGYLRYDFGPGGSTKKLPGLFKPIPGNINPGVPTPPAMIPPGALRYPSTPSEDSEDLKLIERQRKSPPNFWLLGFGKDNNNCWGWATYWSWRWINKPVQPKKKKEEPPWRHIEPDLPQGLSPELRKLIEEGLSDGMLKG